jgi:hypothetical protein
MWHKTSDNLPWDKYYEEIPEDLKKLGKTFTTWFDIQYEWVVAKDQANQPISFTSTDKELKHAPLQIATATCAPWGWDVIPACNASVCHATMIYNLDDLKRYIQIFDTYEPFQKKLAIDYNIPYIMKGILNIRTFEHTIEQVAYVYCTREDVAKAFPASNKFISPIDPNQDIYWWVRNYGIYEMPEVFVDKVLDYSKINKGRIEEASLLDPQIKKNSSSFLRVLWDAIIKYLNDLFS